MNRVTLIGNLGRDPEIRNTHSGRKVASFSMATTEHWRDRDGKRQERTDWHNCVCFTEGLAGVIDQYLRKGSKVAIIGKLQTRSYDDKDGNTRYVTEIIIDELEMLGDPRGGDRDDDRGRGNEGFGRRSRDDRDDRRSRDDAPSRSGGYGSRPRDDGPKDNTGGRGYSSGRDPAATRGVDDDIPF